MSSPEFATLTDRRPRHGRGRRARPAPGHRRSPGWPPACIDVAATLVLGVRARCSWPSWPAPTPTRPCSRSRWSASLVVVFLVYPTAVETLTRGKSLGKLAFGLRVVRDDGGTVTGQQSFVRALIGIVEIYVLFGGPAFFCCDGQLEGQADRRLRRRHLRRPRPGPAHPAGPAPDAAGARRGGPRRPTSGRRRSTWSWPPGSTWAACPRSTRPPASAWARCSPPGSRRTSRPHRPPGTTSWDFLAAVLATRRDRDLARLHRDESLRTRLLQR